MVKPVMTDSMWTAVSTVVSTGCIKEDTHKIDSGWKWKKPTLKVLVVEQISEYTVCS